MIKQRKIELLAPAKNLECGIEAVNHGADAVYIGAPKFGARAAAVNSLEDIAALVEYAHLYNAPYLCDGQYHSERRRAERDGEDDLGAVPHRCGCTDCTGYGGLRG